uniref:OSK domain-containing protein n=1 Tax=Myripristis murdjan TaxID=586833 RepID=A0A667Z3M9_9TELE
MTQNSTQEQANGQLFSSTTKKESYVSGSKSTSSPPWNLLGAKPKHNSGKDTSDMRRRLTGRTQHQEISDETGWPALPSHRSVSSTPVPMRKQPWTVATKRNKTKPHQDSEICLENRFTPLRELTTGPQTLIVGDGAVKDLKRFCSMKYTKVLCFPNGMVSDISEKILKIADEHPTVKSLIIHTGALDVVKQQSEVLKQDFTDLLKKVQSLDMDVYLSGPLPMVRRGDERFSRLMMLSRWLKATCAPLPVNYIDNFHIFWERRHLFKPDGFYLNKSGVRLLGSNIFYFYLQTIWQMS